MEKTKKGRVFSIIAGILFIIYVIYSVCQYIQSIIEYSSVQSILSLLPSFLFDISFFLLAIFLLVGKKVPTVVMFGILGGIFMIEDLSDLIKGIVNHYSLYTFLNIFAGMILTITMFIMMIEGILSHKNAKTAKVLFIVPVILVAVTYMLYYFILVLNILQFETDILYIFRITRQSLAYNLLDIILLGLPMLFTGLWYAKSITVENKKNQPVMNTAAENNIVRS